MRRLALLLVPALLPVLPPAYADAPTCQGQPATIVGKPGKDLTGTSGVDVVVTNGASSATTYEGDDRVCVTGATDDGKRVEVMPGAGNDSVVVTGRNTVKSFLGDGDDRFVGDNEIDVVWGGFPDSYDYAHVDSGTDTILTGDGDDQVRSASGDDVLKLGRGDDSLIWETVSGEAHGGPGTNWVLFYGYGTTQDPGRWLLDNRKGTLSKDGIVRFTFDRFTHFKVGTMGPLTIRGSGEDETFEALYGQAVTIRGDGGDDLMIGTSKADRLLGGPGRDTARGGHGTDVCVAEVRKSCEGS